MKREGSSPPAYTRLSCDDNGRDSDRRVKKGYIPILVGKEEAFRERILIPTKLMKHPYMVQLLEMSANEFGFGHPGTLKIPCDAEEFRQRINMITKGKWNIEICEGDAVELGVEIVVLGQYEGKGNKVLKGCWSKERSKAKLLILPRKVPSDSLMDRLMVRRRRIGTSAITKSAPTSININPSDGSTLEQSLLSEVIAYTTQR
ncbi:hypothetical protein RJ640_017735 [Escallonia rubra]|uniref:Small auxin up regulated protein n=1 Tax=Escallonia rubra TaxID=112253 RepID=A0AA88QRA9_9ASTE|nr:hypothetical protein RJ640_017735 [Escallonia rubra]